jgi:hypothetical protein
MNGEIERSNFVTTRQAYQEKIEAQLKEWQTGIEQLKVRAEKAKADTKIEYEKALNQLAAQQAVAQEKLDDLKAASTDNWEALKSEMDQAMGKLQTDFNEYRKAAEKQGHDVLSWAKGIAQEHGLSSIGWAEGFSSDDEAESAGWAEGQSDDREVESEGWTEGYSQK